MNGQCPRCSSDNVRYIGTCFEEDSEIGFNCHCEECDYTFCEIDLDEGQNVISSSDYPWDEGHECTMCGKPVAEHSGGMCASCKQVWNS